MRVDAIRETVVTRIVRAHRNPLPVDEIKTIVLSESSARYRHSLGDRRMQGMPGNRSAVAAGRPVSLAMRGADEPDVRIRVVEYTEVGRSRHQCRFSVSPADDHELLGVTTAQLGVQYEIGAVGAADPECADVGRRIAIVPRQHTGAGDSELLDACIGRDGNRYVRPPEDDLWGCRLLEDEQADPVQGAVAIDVDDIDLLAVRDAGAWIRGGTAVLPTETADAAAGSLRVRVS